MRSILFVALTAASLLAAVGPSYAEEDEYFFRARFWEWDSFSPGLKKRINQITTEESRATYAFEEGAVSRDLGGTMMREWQQGTATTIVRCVTGSATFPGGGFRFEACPGDNVQYPHLTYMEVRVPRSQVLNHPDPQLAVSVDVPKGCAPAYHVRLTTRKNVDGVNELHADLQTGSEGMNLNFILNCPGG